MPHPMRKAPAPVRCLAAAAFAAVLAAALAGCYDYHDDGFDEPPEVDLAVSPTSALPGDTVRLVAAATDDWRVDEVRFYRVDTVDDVLLGVDERSPWQWDFTVPNVPAGTVLRFRARAIDDVNQRSDSRSVEVTVR